MAVRTPYAPVAASVLTAVNLAKLPGGWIGYVESTTTQSGITANTDLTGLTLTVTVGTGRRIQIVGYGSSFASTVANDFMGLSIFEGATQIGSCVLTEPLANTGITMRVESPWLTPTSGAHTYKLSLGRALGTGTLTHTPSATLPSFIGVVDLGATP